MNNWSLAYNSYDREQEKLRETLCTLGNGYLCTRGAGSEVKTGEHHSPGTYLAGGYNRLATEIAGHTVENEDLVNLPNWLPLTLRIDGGDWFDLDQVELLDFRQELDLKEGVLHRSIRFKDRQDRISRFTQRRLVHMGNRHLAAQETLLLAENWSGRIEVCSALDGRVTNCNVARYRQLANRHLEPVDCRHLDQETQFLKMRMVQSRLEIAMAVRTRLELDGAALKINSRTEQADDFLARYWALDVAEGQTVRVEKTLALYTSRDEAISESGLAACTAIARAPCFDRLLQRHVLCWHQLWEHFSINLKEQDAEYGTRNLMILRLHIFHLLQTASLHTIPLDVGVPSRGWHGEAYRGHIFWDELFIFPLLNLRLPEITRTLLNYRYRRLDEARQAAAEAGYRGAMYPWQSGSNGREESQSIHLNPRSGNWIPDHSHLQRHINAAIVWNTWQYYQITADMEFLVHYGAEMILEIARFWASIARWNSTIERYEILGVMGPDEYHDSYADADTPGLDNNTYTNLMAVWVFTCALELLETLPPKRCHELRETLDLHEDEVELWDQISRRMRLVFHGDGILSQFEGYEQLEELDWQAYRQKYGPVMRLDRILEEEGDTPNRYKCSKQADVLMLFYLFSAEELGALFERLGYPFAYETIPRNINYYVQRTSHGSTLSQMVHSWVLSRLDREGSWQLYTQALRADIDDIQGGTTPEGIHLGAMAGTVDLVQRGYTGIETRGDVLHLNPCLPKEITELKMQISYRGHPLDLTVRHDTLLLHCRECQLEPIKVACCDLQHDLCGGATVIFDLRAGE